MMKKSLWTLIFFFAGYMVLQAQPTVIPQPLSMHLRGDEKLAVNSGLYIQYDSKLAAEANLLSQDLKKVTGIDVKVGQNAPKNASIFTIITLTLDKSVTSGDGSYGLQINNKGVKITASEASGIFYGGVTLQQLLNQPTKDNKYWQFPLVEIQDKPRFGWRGLMLDCSRTFMAPEYLKKTIDRMSFYKLNTLHLHLTDEQGWRLEIEKYPLLTKQGAYFDKKYNEPKEFEGFYTQQQIKEIVAYAQRRHVQVVPEIESPGHCTAALNSYPQLSCTGKTDDIAPFFDRGGLDVFCAGNPDSYKLLNEVIKETAGLFPSPYSHLGGDEVPKNRWKECPKCQAAMHANNIKDEEKLQSYFMSQLGTEVEKYHKRPVAWDEILDGGGINKNWVIMVWRDQETGMRATKDGYDVVMSPSSSLYFDELYSITNTKNVYTYEPIPADASPEEKKHYLGIQGNFWSHICRTESKIDYQLFPRVLALAERAWSDQTVNDFDNFAKRKAGHIYWLNFFDIKYNKDAQ